MSKILNALNESLADEIMATAKSLGMNPRVRGTPEQERERTQNMLAQRTKDRKNQELQSAQADLKIIDQLKDEYEKLSQRYKSLGGSNWQYADREQNLTSGEREARSMESQLRTLGARIDRAEKSQGVLEEQEADYGPEYQDMVKRVGQMAKQGERKVVYDPVKRVYKTVPVQQSSIKAGVDEASKYKKDDVTDVEIKEQDMDEDWQKVNKKDKTDGMSSKAVKAYRRENPGSKLKTAVTTKPSKLKKGSKSAKRRKSFCARMSGMKKAHASAKTKRDPDSPINKALRRWNCESVEQMQKLVMIAEQKIQQLREAANPAQQAAIAVNMKKAGKKPKNLKEGSIMQGIKSHG